MESFSEQEREQIKKFEQLRKLVQMILMAHLTPLVIFFFFILAGSLVGLYVMAERSPYRYEAEVIFHYAVADRNDNIKSLNPKLVLEIFKRKETRDQFNWNYHRKCGEKANCRINIEPVFDKKGAMDRFKVSVRADNENRTVRMANEFAECCLEAYFKEYSSSLDTQLKEFELKVKEVDEELDRIKKEKDAIYKGDPKVDGPELSRTLFKYEKDLQERKKLLEKHQYEFDKLKENEKPAYRALAKCHTKLRNLLKERKENEDALKKKQAALATQQDEFRKLEEQKRNAYPALIKCRAKLKEHLTEGKELNEKIKKEKQLLTEQNPRVKDLISDRQNWEKEFAAFLKENGLSENDANLEMLEDAVKWDHEREKIERTLRDAERHVQDAKKTLGGTLKELDALKDEHKLLDSDLTVEMLEDAIRWDREREKIEPAFTNAEREERNARMLVETTRKKLDHVKKITPEFERLTRQEHTQEASLEKLKNSITELHTRQSQVKQSIRIGERVESAHKLNPLGVKRVAFCIIAAVLLTTLLATLIVLRDFFFGVVSSEKDIKFLSHLQYLGSLPTRAGLFESKNQEQIAFSAIYNALQNSGREHHIMLASALPGGKIIPEFFDAFERNYTMNGKRTLTIDMVLAENFDYDTPGEDDTGIVVHSGGKGVLPVISKKFLSPSELELLKNDLTTLRKSFDLIFIKHSASMRRDRMFVEQIIPLCDGALIAVGLNKTSRRHLRRLSMLAAKTELPIMTILSDNSPETAGKRTNLEVGT